MAPTEDLGFTPIDAEPLLEGSTFVTPSLSFGLTRQLEIELTSGTDQPIFGSLKWQILGQTMNAAGSGNFSFSVKLGFGLFVTGGELPQNEIKGGNQSHRSWTIDSGTWHYQAMVGYRPTELLLFHGGYMIEEYSYQLAFEQGISDVLKYNGRNRGPYLGIAFLPLPLSIKLTAAKTIYEIPSSHKLEDSFYLGGEPWIYILETFSLLLNNHSYLWIAVHQSCLHLPLLFV